MHQQLSLYGTVPDAELKITLHTLAALSGMHPRPVRQHCLVWKPTNPFKPVLKAGEVNQVEQYRVILTNEGDETAVPFKQDSDELKNKIWSMKITEVPEAGKRKVTSQHQLHSTIVDGDPFLFMQNVGYSFEYEYWIRGYRFVFGSIVLNLFRLCTVDKETGQLKLLDTSGRWTVKSHVNVQLINDLEAMNAATEQLVKLQTDLAGLFELVMPDRPSLDTRVRQQ